jgi:hypothetical protein
MYLAKISSVTDESQALVLTEVQTNLVYTLFVRSLLSLHSS